MYVHLIDNTLNNHFEVIQGAYYNGIRSFIYNGCAFQLKLVSIFLNIIKNKNLKVVMIFDQKDNPMLYEFFINNKDKKENETILKERCDEIVSKIKVDSKTETSVYEIQVDGSMKDKLNDKIFSKVDCVYLFNKSPNFSKKSVDCALNLINNLSDLDSYSFQNYYEVLDNIDCIYFPDLECKDSYYVSYMIDLECKDSYYVSYMIDKKFSCEDEERIYYNQWVEKLDFLSIKSFVTCLIYSIFNKNGPKYNFSKMKDKLFTVQTKNHYYSMFIDLKNGTAKCFDLLESSDVIQSMQFMKMVYKWNKIEFKDIKSDKYVGSCAFTCLVSYVLCLILDDHINTKDEDCLIKYIEEMRKIFFNLCCDFLCYQTSLLNKSYKEKKDYIVSLIQKKNKQYNNTDDLKIEYDCIRFVCLRFVANKQDCNTSEINERIMKFVNSDCCKKYVSLFDKMKKGEPFSISELDNLVPRIPQTKDNKTSHTLFIIFFILVLFCLLFVINNKID